MKNESAVTQAFRKHVPKRIMWRRIEDSSGSLGTWDTWLGHDERGGWIEFKHTKTKGAKPKQRAGQAAFGHDLMKSGVKGFYIIGSADGWVRVCSRRMIDVAWPNSLIIKQKNMDEALVHKVLDWMKLM